MTENSGAEEQQVVCSVSNESPRDKDQEELSSIFSVAISELYLISFASLGFEALKRWFSSIGTPTSAEILPFISTPMGDLERHTEFQPVENRSELSSSPLNNNELFCSQEDIDDEEAGHGALENAAKEMCQNLEGQEDSLITYSSEDAKQRRDVAMLSNDDMGRSINIGLQVLLERRRKKDRKTVRRGVKLPQGSKSRKTLSSKTLEFDFDSFFGTNILEDSKVNSTLPPIPFFTKGAKVKALDEIIAKLPEDSKSNGRADKRRLIWATQQFSPSARSNKLDRWMCKGLKTGLFHHQLLGAAFMRLREKSDEPPGGGLLCDIMGFGKTIQTLANILDDLRNSDAVGPTLIVVPRHLVAHWKSQIMEHCETHAIQKVIYWHSQSRVDTSDPVGLLKAHNIIVTTYEEIRMSLPRPNLPPEAFKTEKDLESFYKEHYLETRGPLHYIRYRRIVLDEGHCIRNHESQVSIAVRSLTSEFKWILTGTPFVNGMKDLWAYLSFLDHTNGLDFDSFQQKYCDGNNVDKDKLREILKPVCHRRTHSSRLFTFPVLKLPQIVEKATYVKFCKAEKILYREIEEFWVRKLNGLEGPKRKDAQNRCFFVMLIRLRMFSSHPLAAQYQIQDILNDEIVNELQQSIKPGFSRTHRTRLIADQIKMLYEKLQRTDQRPKSKKLRKGKNLREEYIRLMADLLKRDNIDERLMRTTCAFCHAMILEEGCIVSCMHVYCRDCLPSMKDLSEDSEDGKVLCYFCKEPIEEMEEFNSINSLIYDSHPETTFDFTRAGSKRKSSSKKKEQQRVARKGKKIGNIFTVNTEKAGETSDDQGDSDDDEESKDPFYVNWIPEVGLLMPSSKISGVRTLVKQWLLEDPSTKVVIFTQFKVIVHLFIEMCDREEWKWVKLVGDMRFASREKSMEDFKNKEDISIMIASLKVGGTGLNLTMANKCILVEPWWNEAIAQQAFCRLFRIGQRREVEVVKLVADKTVDVKLLKTQVKKCDEIEQTVGSQALDETKSLWERIIGRKVEGSPHEGFFIGPRGAYEESSDEEDMDDNFEVPSVVELD